MAATATQFSTIQKHAKFLLNLYEAWYLGLNIKIAAKKAREANGKSENLTYGLIDTLLHLSIDK